MPPDPQLSHFNHNVGVCLTTLTYRDHCLDVCTRQVVLLDHRGDKAGVLPLSTLICHREPQTNCTRPCVLSYRQTRSQDQSLPLDVLVIPTRPVPRISDLTSDELKSLMESVKIVGTVVEKAYSGDGLTIACQVRQYHSRYLNFRVYDLSDTGRPSCRTNYPPRSLPHFTPQSPERQIPV